MVGLDKSGSDRIAESELSVGHDLVVHMVYVSSTINMGRGDHDIPASCMASPIGIAIANRYRRSATHRISIFDMPVSFFGPDDGSSLPDDNY
jgi:hypothetical protein